MNEQLPDNADHLSIAPPVDSPATATAGEQLTAPVKVVAPGDEEEGYLPFPYPEQLPNACVDCAIEILAGGPAAVTQRIHELSYCLWNIDGYVLAMLYSVQHNPAHQEFNNGLWATESLVGETNPLIVAMEHWFRIAEANLPERLNVAQRLRLTMNGINTVRLMLRTLKKNIAIKEADDAALAGQSPRCTRKRK